MNARNEQEAFWSETYAEDYIRKNSEFDEALGVEAWRRMLAGAETVESLLECGCNIGRNLRFLETVLPQARKSAIEISEPAYRYVTGAFDLDRSFNGPILEAPFEPGAFDLVFTMGVLIHVHPDNLAATMAKMHALSRRYVLIGEYFNRTPVMLEYQGEKDKLFKRDFGKAFIESHDVRLVDYGFLWGHIYDPAGFDDITWWLFEKN